MGSGSSGDSRLRAQKYAFTAIAGTIAFIIFPLAYTVYFSFTNYSGSHIMTVRQAMLYHMRDMYRLGHDGYATSLIDAGGGRCLIEVSGLDGTFLSSSVELPKGGIPDDAPRMRIRMRKAAAPFPAVAMPVKEFFARRMGLMKADLVLPDKHVLALSGLWRFTKAGFKFTRVKKGSEVEGVPALYEYALYDNEKKALFVPNMEAGFYQYDDAQGRPSGEMFAPGFRVGVGFASYRRFFQSARGPFLRIFAWTFLSPWEPPPSSLPFECCLPASSSGPSSRADPSTRCC